MYFLNFSLLLILWIYHKYGHKWANASALVASFWISLFIFKGIDIWPILATALPLNIAVFIPYKFEMQQAREFKNLNREWENSKQNTRGLTIQLQKIKEEKDELEKHALEIIDLYETSKKMTLTLNFPELFSVLSGVLDKHFIFTNFRLILTGQKGEIEKIIAKDLSELKGNSGDNALLNLSLRIKKSVYLSRNKLADFKEELGALELTNISSLILIPVIFQGEINALMVLENMNEYDYGKLTIFSRQFELAFRKIKLYQRVQELAITDGLTQVYVRRHFERRLQEEKERAEGNNIKMGILLIDLDHFKKINDKYGHLVGDAVLKELSQIVKSSVRETDLVGRWGGEELIVLLTDSDRNLTCLVAERIRQIIEKHTFKAYDETVKLTLSIGIAIFPDEVKTIPAWLERADKALYQAKALGRNRIFTFFQEKT